MKATVDRKVGGSGDGECEVGGNDSGECEIGGGGNSEREVESGDGESKVGGGDNGKCEVGAAVDRRGRPQCAGTRGGGPLDEYNCFFKGG